jgi:LUD domain
MVMAQEEQREFPSQSVETKTEYGIPIDYSFSKPASEEQIQRTAESLRKRGFVVEVVNTPGDARNFVKNFLPHDKTIFTALSETVKISGLGQDINGPESSFKSLRKELDKMDPVSQFRERVKLGAAPDIVVGSVHAVTESGQVLVGSGSGNQLGPYAASAEKVIWLVGSQKIVPDFETGMRRLEMYSYPLEDIRMHKAFGRGSLLAKVLIMNAERPGRITIVLIREAIGF